MKIVSNRISFKIDTSTMSKLYFGLLFILVFGFSINSAVAQQHYKFNSSTKLYDLPGSNFLTSSAAEFKIAIQELDSTGMILWSDTINKENEILNFDTATVVLKRFRNSDNFCLFFQENAPNKVILHYSIFNITNRDFQPIKTVELPTYYQYLSYSEISDEEIFVYTYVDKYRQSVHRVDVNGEVELINNGDNVITAHTQITDVDFIRTPTGILALQADYQHVFSQPFSDDMEPLASIDSTPVMNPFFTGNVFANTLKNADSLFTFYEASYDQGIANRAWVMTWSTPDLKTLRYVEVSLVGSVKYFSRRQAVVMTNDRVYVLAEYNINSSPYLDLFRYNHEFEEQCHGVDVYKRTFNHYYTLSQLNDRVYLNVVNPQQKTLELFLIDDCSVGTGVLETALNTLINSISIYPNPTEGHFTLKTSGRVAGRIAFIVDILGQPVAKIELTSDFQNTISTNLVAGVYFLKIGGYNSEPLKLVIK